jgi:hypothetical protein
MKKKPFLSAMLICLLAFCLSLLGCPTDSDDDSVITKFEGKWVNPVAIIDNGYSDFSFTFTGNKMLFKSSDNNGSTTKPGTFTFTDSEITFIPERESTWAGYTQTYTLQDNVLQLENNGTGSYGPFQKQDDDFGTAPFLTGFITLNEKNSLNQQWIQNTVFGVNDGINVAIRGYDLEGDIKELAVSAKRNGSDFAEKSIDKDQGKKFTQFWGSLEVPSGDYILDVYAVDAKGNKSNTLSTMFTVNGQ